MRIISKGDRLIAVPLANMSRVEWVKGSHTAEVYAGNDLFAHDVFTFAFEKNRTSMLDFTTALQSHIEYMEN